MILVLAVTPDAAVAQHVRSVLSAQGWWVSVVGDREAALRVAADHEPALVLVDSTIEGAIELVGIFGSKNGGPGALVMASPDREDDTFAVYEAGADQILGRPPRADSLLEAANQIMSTPHQSVGGAAPGMGKKMSAGEIFGDVLSEIESGSASGGELESVEQPLEEEPVVAQLSEPAAELEETEVEASGEAASQMLSLEEIDAPVDFEELAPEAVVSSIATREETSEVSAVESGSAAADLSSSGTEVPLAQSAETGGRTGPAASPRPVAQERRAVEADSAAPIAEEGERFGQYILHERIAVGGMAEVWRASMLGLEGFRKTVAIKKILPHLAENGDFVRMFIEEAKLAAQLNHENLVDIYDLGKIDSSFFIAMEFVDGHDLRSVLNRLRQSAEQIPLGLALLIAAEVASGLGYAHSRKSAGGERLDLVHRDVSPRNVLIGSDGRVRLCDFGVAKAVSSVIRTEIGALKGKLQYMSPEQASGKPVDARSDIYSLGSVLYEMVAGKRLFRADNEASLLDAVRAGNVDDPAQHNPGLPPDVRRVLLKALARKPSARYQKASGFAEELMNLARSFDPLPSEQALGEFAQELFEEPDIVRVSRASGDLPEEPASQRPSTESARIETATRPSAMSSISTVRRLVVKSRAARFWLGVAAGLIAAGLVAGGLKLALDWMQSGSQPRPPALEEVAPANTDESIVEEEVRRREAELREAMVEEERRQQAAEESN